ncbi:MAG: damage-inducible protein [Rhodospirillales bacterium]|nr:damage-inducible protein [Rhodospirillales bacterium]
MPPDLATLRARIARLERPPARERQAPLRFGLAALDTALPSGGLAHGGLARGALHEIAGTGAEAEHGAAAALFLAALLARTPGPVLWVQERADLFAPGLAAMGLAPERVIQVEAGRGETVLAVLEDGLRQPALLAGVGEISGPVALAASRRLALAAAASGVTGFLLRRPWRAEAAALAAPSAALTRWRIGALPSAPPFADAPEIEGLGPARWRVELWRARGGVPAVFVVEGGHGSGGLRLVALGENGPAAPGRRRAAG